MDRRCRIDLIVGTRPNMVKLAVLHQVLQQAPWCSPRVVFIRQHEMPSLGSGLLEDFGILASQVQEIPLPSGDYGSRLGAMISGYSALIADAAPDLVVVFGDVDTTLAAALAAKRAQLPLAHIEAGLRSHDRTMPEEINRRLVDAISDLHFVTSADAIDNLRAEGHTDASLHLVGNPMIDALSRYLDTSAGVALCQQYGLRPRGFAIATFHRPANVDTAAALARLADALEDCAKRLPIWLPMHPRTRTAIQRHKLWPRFQDIADLHISEPLSYMDFIALMSQSRAVLTDSGGLQEEASWLGIPCLTMRPNTERPVTISLGTNRLVDEDQLASALVDVLDQPMPSPASILLWEGKASSRIAEVLHRWASTRDGSGQ